MSAALIEHFELLAASLGGVAKLRELILSLAVRGKLTHQDPADEPASELLKKIRAEKDRLIKEGKIKRDKPLSPIADDEKPYELPEGWEWVRLAGLGGWAIGSGFPNAEQGLTDQEIPFAKVSDMNLLGNEKEIRQTNNSISSETAARIRINVHPPGTVVFPKIGGAIATNKRRILVKPTAIDNNCLGITPNEGCSTPYLYLLLTSIDFTKYQVGTSVPALSQGILGEIVLSLPPLPEQSRIVAKVEELIALCDKLEAEQGRAARVQGHWVEAALTQLAESADVDEFHSHWQHLAEHFDTLFTTPESVTQLDATLLQLAVRGKLAPQDPADEPASELLKKIRAEKDRLIKEGKIKRLPAGRQAEISDDEKPYELPEGWEWARLGTISEFTNGFAFPSGEFTDSGVGIVKIGDIQNGGVRTENMSYVSTDYAQKIDQCFKVRHGDMLIAMSGATTGKLGFNTTDQVFFLNQRVGKIEMYLTNVQFAYRYLNTKIAENLAISAGSAIPNISTVQIKEIEFPLPPLAEQSRIIAQLEQLLTLTYELKARITATYSKQAHLAEVLIQEILAV